MGIVWAAGLAAVAVQLAAAPLQAATMGVPDSYPRIMTPAQSDYVENCGGCHGIHGIAAPADLPTLKGQVGYFLCTPAARAYLLRLPNVALSRIADNAALAELMNFAVFGLGGRSVPAGALPFTADEVARERAKPLTSVSLVKMRRLLVEDLIRRGCAPPSLRSLYPGQAG